MAASLPLFHVIKDPVHGTMQFSAQENDWIKPFLDSDSIQRLRHIKQLGFADWVYPGAVHTRFNHSIGCCYVASQICNKLKLSDEDKQLGILAGLLHDVGHGPFSHTFEHLFHNYTIQHEMWTPLFLEEYMNETFIGQFNRRNPDFPLDEKKLDFIRALIMHETTDNRLLNDIVSSQLDADRLDYLLRDSHFCGVTYGAYDFRWLLHCLTIINVDQEQRLGITHKGIGVVEEYLMARRLMMLNVYRHGKKFGVEFFLKHFLKLLAKALEEERLFETLEENALLRFLKAMNQFNGELKNTESIKKLQENFMRDNFHLYRSLKDYHVFELIFCLSSFQENHDVVTLAKRLQHRRLPKILQIHEKSFKKAQALIDEFKAMHLCSDWQIGLLHLPLLSYKLKDDPILIRDVSNEIKCLHDKSLMIDALSDREETAYFACFDQALLEQKEGLSLYQQLQKF